MRRPFRRYCYSLAEKLNMPLKTLQETLNNNEITEWMAYDLTKDEVFIEGYKKEQQVENSKQMTAEQKQKLFAAHFRGKNGNNSKPPS